MIKKTIIISTLFTAIAHGAHQLAWDDIDNKEAAELSSSASADAGDAKQAAHDATIAQKEAVPTAQQITEIMGKPAELAQELLRRQAQQVIDTLAAPTQSTSSQGGEKSKDDLKSGCENCIM